MKKLFTILCLTGAVTSLLAQNNKASLQADINAFDSYVQKTMQDWQIPGMAVAIVKNNEIIFTKGYGVREIGTSKKVDTKTIFECASTTKAMTAVCMGILVDEGKVNWSDPVIKYLPDFKLHDPYVTRELTIQDLFLHNSGVGNTDYLWADNTLTSDEIVTKMQLVKPSYSFRSSFVYQNIFYLVAGKVIEKVSGKPWHIFIKENIFNPLGMQHTKALLSDVKDENQAMPHFLINNKPTRVEMGTADAIAPAGSVNSCADDMALWMQCMIDSSKYKNKRLVKPSTWQYLLQPKTMVPASEFYSTQTFTKPGFTTYAMGWFQQDYKGHKLNFHTGSLDGAVAIHAQIPDRKFGIYVFENLDHAELRHALMFKAIDLFELGGTTDWSALLKPMYDSLKLVNSQQDSANIPTQIGSTAPLLNLQSYTGIFEDELYGNIKIELVKNELKATVNNTLHATLTHFHFNTFKTIYTKIEYPADYYNFQLNEHALVTSIEIKGVVYKRKQGTH